MKVKELIKHLRTFDPDCEVLVSLYGCGYTYQIPVTADVVAIGKNDATQEDDVIIEMEHN